MKITKLYLLNKKKIQDIKTSFAKDIDKGLSSKNKAISSKYFYDDKGSNIFQKITKHPDYYPTKKEIEILYLIQNKLPHLIKLEEIDIIELGPGDGTKSKIIIDGFLKNNYKVNYYPIDISKKALQLLSNNFAPNKNLLIHGIIGEYLDGLKFIKKESKNKQLVLFLGSSIGNFDIKQSKKFVKKLNPSLSGRWEKTKVMLIKNPSSNGLNFKPWDLPEWSVKVSKGEQAHLVPNQDSSSGIWEAIKIGDHKFMGHG